MRKFSKKGQGIFGMSFGFIFSIILIIALIGVTMYAIAFFLNLSGCTNIGLFYDSLQDEIDRAWSSGIYSDTLGKIPTGELEKAGIEMICFGELDSTTSDNPDLQRELEDALFENKDNLFLSPPNKACEGELASYDIKHIQIEKFFCVNVDKLDDVLLTKNATEAQPKLSKRRN